MEEHAERIVDIIGALRQIEMDLQQDDNAIKLRGLKLAHKLSLPNSNFERLSSTDMMGNVVKCLQIKDAPDIQTEAARLMGNFGVGHTEFLMKSKAFQLLIEMLGSSSPQLVAESLKALGIFIYHRPEILNELLGMKLLGSIKNILIVYTNNVEVMRPLGWTLSNIVSHCSASDVLKCIVVWERLFCIDDEVIIGSCCRGFSYICETSYNEIEEFITVAGVLPRFIEVLTGETSNVVANCLRHTIGRIVEANSSQAEVAVKSGILPKLMLLLQCDKSVIVDDAAWILSKIVANDKNQISAVMESGVIPLLFSVIEMVNDAQNEALIVIRNITRAGSMSDILHLCDLGVVPLLRRCLDIADWSVKDAALWCIANMLESATQEHPVESFMNMLEESGCPDKMDELCSAENEQVSNIARWIMESYFDDDDTDDGSSSSEDNYIVEMRIQAAYNRGYGL